MYYWLAWKCKISDCAFEKWRKILKHFFLLPSPWMFHGCRCSHSFKNQGLGAFCVFLTAVAFFRIPSHPACVPTPCLSDSYPMPLTSKNNSYQMEQRLFKPTFFLQMWWTPGCDPWVWKWVLAVQVHRPHLQSGFCHFLNQLISGT